MQTTPQYEPWEPCPPGELQQLAVRLRTERRRIAVRRGARFAAAATLILLAAYATFLGTRRAPNDYLHGGLYCSQVRPLLPDYAAGKLDPEMARKLKGHLDECPPCRKFLSQLPRQVAVRPGGPAVHD